MTSSTLPELPDDVQQLLQDATSVTGPDNATRDAILARVHETCAAPVIPLTEAKSPNASRTLIALSATLLTTAALLYVTDNEKRQHNISEEPARAAEQRNTETNESSNRSSTASDINDIKDTPTITMETNAQKQVVVHRPQAVTATTTSSSALPNLSSRGLSASTASERRQPELKLKPTTVNDVQDARKPAERYLILTARAQFLAGRYNRSLRLLRKHRKLYRKGTLAEERDALTVRAYAGSGKTTIARQKAAAFAARYPGSIHLPAIRSALD